MPFIIAQRRISPTKFLFKFWQSLCLHPNFNWVDCSSLLWVIWPPRLVVRNSMVLLISTKCTFSFLQKCTFTFNCKDLSFETCLRPDKHSWYWIAATECVSGNCTWKAISEQFFNPSNHTIRTHDIKKALTLKLSPNRSDTSMETISSFSWKKNYLTP